MSGLPRVRTGVKAGFADIPAGHLARLAADGTADFAEFSLCEDPFPDWRAYGGELPVRAVHAPHFSSHGFNPVDPAKRDESLRMLELASEAADGLDAACIIVHPERSTGPACSPDAFAAVLSAWGDPRCVVENMPMHGFFLVEHAEVREFLVATGVGLCLDVAHAAGYAYLTGRDFGSYLEGLAALGPAHWHASDTRYRRIPAGQHDPDGGGYEDAHLALGTGDIDWRAVGRVLPAGAWVTMETPKGPSQASDAALLRSLG